VSAEAEEQQTIGGGSADSGRGVDPAAKRNLVIMGVVGAMALVVVGGVAYAGLSGNSDPVVKAASTISLGNPTAERRDSGEALPPRMQEELAKRQNEDAERAAAEGRSYMPPDTTARIESVNNTPKVQLSAANSSAGLGSAAIVDRSAQEQERRKGLEKFLTSFDEAAVTADAVRSRFGPSAEGGRSQPVAAQRVSAAAPSPAASSAAAPGRKLVEALTVMATRLTLPLNIPANGSATVLVEVVAGPHTGAFLSGTAKVVNEGIEIRLTQARLGKEPYAIQAIGLDGTTSDQILEGSVDRKLFQRYVIPIAAAAAQGFFTARAAVGSTLVGLESNGGSLTGVQVPAPTSKQATAAGLAAGMQVVAADASKIAATPIVVSIPSQTPMGVLFLNEVIEKGATQ
jgi:hypothetical protein